MTTRNLLPLSLYLKKKKKSSSSVGNKKNVAQRIFLAGGENIGYLLTINSAKL